MTATACLFIIGRRDQNATLSLLDSLSLKSDRGCTRARSIGLQRYKNHRQNTDSTSWFERYECDQRTGLSIVDRDEALDTRSECLDA